MSLMLNIETEIEDARAVCRAFASRDRIFDFVEEISKPVWIIAEEKAFGLIFIREYGDIYDLCTVGLWTYAGTI